VPEAGSGFRLLRRLARSPCRVARAPLDWLREALSSRDHVHSIVGKA